MKRLFTCLAAACILFAGCAGPPDSASTVPVDKRPEELVYWSMWEEFSSQADAIRQLTDAYTEDTGIPVQIRWNGQNNPQLVHEALEQGETVDLFDGNCTVLSSGFARLLADLDEPARLAGYDDFAVSALPQTVRENAGGLVCIPYQIQMSGILYDRQAFAAAGIEQMPASWDEFAQVCRKLRQAGYCPLAVTEETAACLAGYHLGRALGGDFIQADWTSSAKALSALDCLAQFAQDGLVSAAEQAPANAAMLLGNTTVLAQRNRDGGEWGIFCYPALPEGSQPATTAALQAAAFAIPQASRCQKEAFELVMRMTSGEGDELLSAAGGTIPADTRSRWPAVLQSAQGTFSALTSVFVPDTAIYDYLQEQAGPAVFSLLRGQSSSEQVLRQLKNASLLKLKREELS